MRRAEQRERRSATARTYFVILTWQREAENWRVNFLDIRSRLPITRQRIYKNSETVLGLIDRSLTGLKAGPARAILLKRVQSGRGEVEIELSAEQYISLLQTP